VGLAAAVERALRRHAMLAGGERVLVAVSGGADSVALLHLLVALAPRWRLDLHVLHVDHGLREDSAADAAFVRGLAAGLGVPAAVARVTVPPGGSREAAAREARYAALEAEADRVGAARIAVGHTADDQAETVLMRVLAGAGVRGLAGIPPVRGRIVRPLLEVRHARLVEALAAAGVAWREDPTNRDPKFWRNRLRHEVLPWLETTHAPHAVAALARVARLARAAADALDRQAAEVLDRLGVAAGGAIVLPRAALAALPREIAAETLRQAAARLGGRASLRAWGHRGLRRVLASPPPRRPFRLGGIVIEVSGERVRLGTASPAPLRARPVARPGRTALPEVGLALVVREVPAAGYRVPREADRAAFDADALAGPLGARPRRRGDRFVAFGGVTRRLKSLLIDAGVPRWERARVPLLEAGGDIVWVIGLRRGAAAPVTAATRRVLEVRVTPLAEDGSGG
jgi:tRNA(Ile)-lysidine synthase